LPQTSRTRVLPYDEQAERRVLGACLLSATALDDARRVVSADDFHLETFGRWYAEAITMRDQGEPIEPDLLASRLQLDTKQRSRLAETIASTTAASNVIHYARIVYADARRRELIRAAADLRKAAYNGGLEQHPDIIERVRQAIDGAPRGRAAKPLNLAELLAGPAPETDWLWNGWIAWEDINLIVGDPKTGKSLLALGLACAARNGTTFLGEQVSQARIGIFDLENPLGEVHKRLRRIGLTHDNHDGIVYLHTPAMNLATIDGISQLTATVEEHELDLVIIDSFRRSAPGIDENDSAAVSAFFAPLRRLIAGRRRTIIVIHHARKRTGGDLDKEPGQMTRGSGDFLAAIDSQIYLRKKGPGKFNLEHGANRRGLEHETILVTVSNAEDENLTFTNEGSSVSAESKLDELVIRILEALREEGGGPTTSTALKIKLGVNPKEQRTFYNALKLGFEKEWLAKTEPSSKNEPTEWSLVEGTWG
jgi:hypothetical protein